MHRETPFFVKNGVSRTLPPKNFYSEGIFSALQAEKMPSDTAFLLKVRKLLMFWNRKVSEYFPFLPHKKNHLPFLKIW